jgi:uncharacterized protein
MQTRDQWMGQGVTTWHEAVSDGPEGVRLLVEVAPGAKQDRFPDGSNPWREGRIGIRVKAPATEGRANDAVASLVAAFFELAPSNVTVATGALDSRKTLLLRGIVMAEVLARLTPALES